LATKCRKKMSIKTRAAITGIQGYVPPDVLSNKDLEQIVDTNDEWIYSRTGIRERRILKGEMRGASEMGVLIVKGLLDKTGTAPDDIEVVICATVTGDYVFPDTANVICDKVGIRNAYGFDLNAACSGFLFALNVGARMIESGAYKKIIIIGLDKMSSIVDYTDRTTCILFGDGGGAVLLEPSTDGNGLIDADLHGDGSGRHYLHMKAGGSVLPPSLETVQNRMHYVYQEGRTVFKYAVRGMAGAVEKVLKRNNLTMDDVAWLVPHQANMRIINSVAEALDFPVERVMINIEKYGNTTSGTLPLCLWEWEKQLKKGDNIVLAAFGGGFTWGAILLKWGYNS
jgi:3-oxoacyl-[acyl-carrier-protein] synthase-3